jgi:alpha-1,2-mannosyltransferase
MVPAWLVPYIDPWTTPAALWVVAVALAALLGLRGARLSILAAGVAVGIAIWKAWAIGPPTGLLDLMIYTNSAQAWLDGSSLFSYRSPTFNLSATYPPVGLLLFALITPLSTPVREVLFTCFSIVAIGGAARCAAVLAGIARDRRLEWTLWALALAIVTMPVWLTLRQGQINAILWLLVLGDVVLLARGSRFGGIGIGIATAIKLVPGLFIVWLVVVGWRKPALRAVLTVLALTAFAWILDPGDSRLYWTDLLWHSENVGMVDDARNNSLLAALGHTTDAGPTRSALWLVAVALVSAVGLWRARRATKSNDLLAAVVIVGCTSALVSPISWTHHLGYLVLALAAMLPLVTTRVRLLLLGVATIPLVDPGHLGDDVFMSMIRTTLMLGLVLFLPIIVNRSQVAEPSEGTPDTGAESTHVESGDQAARTPSSRSTNS